MVESAVLVCILLAVAYRDFLTYRIPDVLNATLALVGLTVSAVRGSPTMLESLVGVVAGFGLLWLVAALYEAVRGRPGLGLGDAKLFGAAGAWVGVAGLPSVLLWATLIALVHVVGLRLAGYRITARTRVPFGPSLAFALWFVWLFGYA